MRRYGMNWKMAPGRNDDCWCGSRRKYMHCQYQIDTAPDEQKYAASQAVYARNWKVTALQKAEVLRACSSGAVSI